MRNLILQIIAGVLSLWLAAKFVPGVQFIGAIQYLIIAGSILGIANFFLKPALNAITLPLRIITLGISGLIINMLMVWIIDIVFPELIIKGIVPLFWTTALIWLVTFFLGLSKQKNS